MTTPEMTNSYEQYRLKLMAKQLERTNTPREITIKYILSLEQVRKAQAAKEEAEESERIARRSLFAVIDDRDQLKEENDQLKAESVYIEKIGDLIDENLALKEKLNAILAIINPDQTQE